MTLDEAIKHCEEVAYQKDLESGFDTDNERYAMADKERTDCKKCSAEYRQLVKWLKELRAYRKMYHKEWIPCSERLPNKNGFYLCTTKDCITILEFRGGNPHYHEKPSFVSDVLGRCNSYVVAWMPLPEPYKAEMESEE